LLPEQIRCPFFRIDVLEQYKEFYKTIQDVLEQYKEFYKTINALILQRESSLLSKQVNIFTTLSSSLIRDFCISFTNFKSLSNSIFLPSARQETEPCNIQDVLEQYKEFYKTINALILQRESSLLSKQVSLFLHLAFLTLQPLIIAFQYQLVFQEMVQKHQIR
jgi:shikimate kinase